MDLHFETPPEIEDHLSVFGKLISTYYHLGHSNSILGYYLGRIAVNWDAGSFLAFSYITAISYHFLVSCRW